MSRKKAKASDEAPTDNTAADMPIVAAIPGAAIEMIELGRLARAPENVRQQHDEGPLEELAADIEGHGLIQSLIGYEVLDTPPADPVVGIFEGATGVLKTIDGRPYRLVKLDRAGDSPRIVWIVGGGRRLAGMQLLAARGRLAPTYPVPVMIRPQNEAIELSLAENLARQDMNPVDQFRGFKRMMDLANGTMGPADVARRFGYTAEFVRQRMRLAGLVDEVLDALGAGRITIEAAMAYASTQDLDAQRRVFKSQEKSTWKPHDPDTIKREIGGATLIETDRLVRYIGVDAYVAAGGEFEDALFAPYREGERRLIDTALVRQLARDKAEAALPTLAEQHGFAELVLTLDADAYGNPKAVKAPKGTAKIERDYYLMDEKALRTIRDKAGKKSIPVTGVAVIDREGSLAVTDRLFFVPKGDAESLKPKQREPRHHQMTPEEREAAERERYVSIWSPRLAIPHFAGTPYEGRAFWPNAHWAPNLRTHPELGEGYMIDVEIFVPAADRDAQVEEAGRRYDEARAEKARKEEEARQAAEAATAARAGLVAQLLADPPAVVRIDEEPFDFYRREDGSYPDCRPGQGEEEAEYGFEDLQGLLDHAEAIGSTILHWPTIEAFDNDGIGTTPGMCRVCECEEHRACDDGGEPCSWADDTRTLCTNPACLAVAAGSKTANGIASADADAGETPAAAEQAEAA